MELNRRGFIAHAARIASLAAWAAAFPSVAQGSVIGYPFKLGVASGSPRPTSIVLWTRILSDALSTAAPDPRPIAVRWEIAEDDGFQRIAAKGNATALAELAHSVHVDVSGLRPDRWYWYRFMTADAISPIGRTRTAPAPEAMPTLLKVAVASCQHWDFGEYGAHRHIAAATPDVVAFLGDYIYEWGPYRLDHPDKAVRTNESFTLADYRARYAQYKSDRHLQSAHQAAPWIVTWDDHEVANDYGGDRDYLLDPQFLTRRAAAYQAFYEHMPIRLPALPSGPNRFAQMRIHDRYDWGRLARFHVLDSRQHRAYQVCPKPGRGGSTSVTSACAERIDPARSLLGRDQESWLANGFATSSAQWNILAQQTLMAQSSQLPIVNPDDGRFWTDGWDGYPAARRRLLEDIAKHRPANPIVISGDVHTFYAAELRRDFDRNVSAANPILASEFCGTSITSSSRPQQRTEQQMTYNPHIKYGRSDRRGFMMLELSPAKTTARFVALDDVRAADSGIATVASFMVADGKPGVMRSD